MSISRLWFPPTTQLHYCSNPWEIFHPMIQVYCNGSTTQIVGFPYKIKSVKIFDEFVMVWNYNALLQAQTTKPSFYFMCSIVKACMSFSSQSSIFSIDDHNFHTSFLLPRNPTSHLLQQFIWIIFKDTCYSMCCSIFLDDLSCN